MAMDPNNPVTQVFLRKCRIHPAQAPKREKPAPEFKLAGNHPDDKFHEPAQTAAERWSRMWLW